LTPRCCPRASSRIRTTGHSSRHRRSGHSQQHSASKSQHPRRERMTRCLRSPLLQQPPLQQPPLQQPPRCPHRAPSQNNWHLPAQRTGCNTVAPHELAHAHGQRSGGGAMQLDERVIACRGCIKIGRSSVSTTLGLPHRNSFEKQTMRLTLSSFMSKTRFHLKV
jgi:hypothetical protein